MSHITSKTDAEWRDAVDLARTCLLIDSARQYVLVKGGPKVNAGRCEQLLRLDAERGTVPRKAAVKRCLKELLSC